MSIRIVPIAKMINLSITSVAIKISEYFQTDTTKWEWGITGNLALYALSSNKPDAL
jgi:hypothetical protein